MKIVICSDGKNTKINHKGIDVVSVMIVTVNDDLEKFRLNFSGCTLAE